MRVVTLTGSVSQIGGQLGLFMGVTVMTVVQLLLNAFLLVRRQLRRVRKALKPPSWLR